MFFDLLVLTIFRHAPGATYSISQILSTTRESGLRLRRLGRTLKELSFGDAKVRKHYETENIFINPKTGCNIRHYSVPKPPCPPLPCVMIVNATRYITTPVHLLQLLMRVAMPSGIIKKQVGDATNDIKNRLPVHVFLLLPVKRFIQSKKVTDSDQATSYTIHFVDQ
jgi:hypothetical protein